MRAKLPALALGAALACASAPRSLPDRGLAWGHLELVPRVGVETAAGPYGDRRLRDVEWVDYDRPGFAVVWAESNAADASPPSQSAQLEPVEIELREGRVAARMTPSYVALEVGAPLRIVNRGARVHTVSIPSRNEVRALPAGASITFRLDAAGPTELHLLDAPDAQATAYAAPGPFSVVAESGRFQLDDLPPGRARLHAWHPRFPPAASRWVELRGGQATRVDLQMGVGLE